MRLPALPLAPWLALLSVGAVSSRSHLVLVSAAADQACASDELAALVAIAAAQSGLLHDCETQSGYVLYPFTSYPTTAQQSVVCIGRSCPNVIANFQQAAALPECLVTVDGQQMTTVAFLDSICDVRTPTPTPTPTSTATTAPTSTPAASSGGPGTTEVPSPSPSQSAPTPPASGSSGSTSTAASSATPTSDNETGSSVTASASASASASGSSVVDVSASGSEDLSVEPPSSASASALSDVAPSSGSEAGSATKAPEPTTDGASRSTPELLLTALVVGALAFAEY